MRGLAGMFEAQVESTPAAPAVIFGGRVCTYRELNAAANRLAHWLILRGVQPEEHVGVCLSRSIDMIVAVLAVVKAGGAYVPLDPSYPAERLLIMQADSQPRIVLAHVSQAPRHALHGQRRAKRPCPCGCPDQMPHRSFRHRQCGVA